MNTVCRLDMCCSCRVCEYVCPVNAVSIDNRLDRSNAIIDNTKCIRCDICKNSCPQNIPVEKHRPFLWKQGWAEGTERLFSSSGGICAAISRSVCSSGGFVCSCCFSDNKFHFEITGNEDDVTKFSGSKYVKSDMENIYSRIENILNKGKTLLFIGLPCQVAATKKLFSKYDNLYTIDLICHGTPSVSLLELYLRECGIRISDIEDISFRNKGIDNDESTMNPLIGRGVVDCYTYCFLDAVDYTENCYLCHYASIERVADITLGDAWGALSDTEKKGVNLVLCQTDKGMRLLSLSDIHFEDVNLEKAISKNHQLSRPSTKHPKRNVFFTTIKRTQSFKFAAFLAKPHMFCKQFIKNKMIRFGFIKNKEIGGYQIRLKINKH